jgi:adenine-specific DNA-methyltransferase
LFDYLERIDETLIAGLLQDEVLRSKFFVPIKDVFVFKMNDFRFFMEENKINNSYTTYKNRIGLGDGKRLLKNSQEVVLHFPYKDCVLEGGQSTEEGQDKAVVFDSKTGECRTENKKRNEVFFNQILAKDEIDRLFDAKALTHWQRHTATGGEAVANLRRRADGTIQENLIIKGNNLLALHSLKKQFTGKVKLIYIDPPYNPPSNNNTFAYNNNFNHSTWLTFMKNRLEIGKKLLSNDGAFIVAIDKNEVHYLGVMIDELFPEYESHCVTIVHNPRGVIGTNFSYTHEYAYFIFPKGQKIIVKRCIAEEEIEFSNLRNWGAESLRSDAKNCFYSILVDKCTNEIIDFGDVCHDDYSPLVNVHKNDFVEIYPIDKNGVERKWRYARQSVEDIKHLLRVKQNKGIYDIQIGKDFGTYRTVWIDKKYDANEYGTKIVNHLVKNNDFSFPKSLWNVYDCIYAVVGNDKNAIVLDYHAGSGTTAHAVLELNKRDGGNRRFIMVEQMSYISTVTCLRVKKVMENENINDSFIYVELAKWNESAKEALLAADSLPALEALFEQMTADYFLNYNLNIKVFQAQVLKEEGFRALTLDEQKRFFIEMLDNNQLYVQATEMADKKFGISAEDQALTKAFYEGGN